MRRNRRRCIFIWWLCLSKQLKQILRLLQQFNQYYLNKDVYNINHVDHNDNWSRSHWTINFDSSRIWNNFFNFIFNNIDNRTFDRRWGWVSNSQWWWPRRWGRRRWCWWSWILFGEFRIVFKNLFEIGTNSHNDLKLGLENKSEKCILKLFKFYLLVVE